VSGPCPWAFRTSRMLAIATTHVVDFPMKQALSVS
jgi:hypothetical protein